MSKVRPVILSCDLNRALTSVFVWSYRKVCSTLARPIVVVETSIATEPSPAYMALIESLEPDMVHVHPREPDMTVVESAQEGATYSLRVALDTTRPDELLMFVEDDVVFSTRLPDQLETLALQPDAGFLTLYQPFDGYGSTTIDPTKFYGTQCVLFPRRPAAEIVENWPAIRGRVHRHWDIVWAHFLAERGYILYAAEGSYVQHLQAESRMQKDRSPLAHWSNRFVE